MQNCNFAYGSVWVLITDIVEGKEVRPKVFENMVLRRIFGQRRVVVTGGWTIH
jgi:hypothetical protein